jgi:hypothetical protein
MVRGREDDASGAFSRELFLTLSLMARAERAFRGDFTSSDELPRTSLPADDGFSLPAREVPVPGGAIAEVEEDAAAPIPASSRAPVGLGPVGPAPVAPAGVRLSGKLCRLLPLHTGEGPEFSTGTGSLILIWPRRNAATVVLLRCGGTSSSDGMRWCATIFEVIPPSGQEGWTGCGNCKYNYGAAAATNSTGGTVEELCICQAPLRKSYTINPADETRPAWSKECN